VKLPSRKHDRSGAHDPRRAMRGLCTHEYLR
jgi:hypothetical protein